MDWAETTATRNEKQLSLGIWCKPYIRSLTVVVISRYHHQVWYWCCIVSYCITTINLDNCLILWVIQIKMFISFSTDARRFRIKIQRSSTGIATCHIEDRTKWYSLTNDFLKCIFFHKHFCFDSNVTVVCSQHFNRQSAWLTVSIAPENGLAPTGANPLPTNVEQVPRRRLALHIRTMDVTCLNDKCYISGRPLHIWIWATFTYLGDVCYISGRLFHTWTVITSRVASPRWVVGHQ